MYYSSLGDYLSVFAYDDVIDEQLDTYNQLACASALSESLGSLYDITWEGTPTEHPDTYSGYYLKGTTKDGVNVILVSDCRSTTMYVYSLGGNETPVKSLLSEIGFSGYSAEYYSSPGYFVNLDVDSSSTYSSLDGSYVPYILEDIYVLDSAACSEAGKLGGVHPKFLVAAIDIVYDAGYYSESLNN